MPTAAPAGDVHEMVASPMAPQQSALLGAPIHMALKPR